MSKTKKIIFAVGLAYLTVQVMRRYEDMLRNKKQWYVLRLTQDGALKWTTLLYQRFPLGDVAIVTTYESLSADPEDVRHRDVIFHVEATAKEMAALKMLLGEQIVQYKKMES